MTLARRAELVGRPLGHTEWREMTQERVDPFADVTEDHNYIHVDVERAKASPFGGTIAHGYLTVSLLAPISQSLLEVDRRHRASTTAWTGCGSRRRCPSARSSAARARSTDVATIKGGMQATVLLAVEVKGSERPALIADCLFRFYA